MKRLIICLVIALASICLSATAATSTGRVSNRIKAQNRLEVITWQENFETGAPGWTHNVDIGADLWHLATVADAPSPTHAMVCQNAQGTYEPNMMNYLISPPITLPATGAIRADFMLKGDFSDPDMFPDIDYFGWQISVNNGGTWFYMSNPYNEPNGMNYVYSDAPENWASMTGEYALNGYISDYAGQTVRFRWYFQSDSDAPIGNGIMIDNFAIYNDLDLAPPTNLTASVDDNNVSLSWTAPGEGGGGGEPGWLQYDDGFNNDGIGLSNGGTFQVAIKWDANGIHSISPWVGMNITQVKFWPNESGVTYTLKIYTGTAGTMVYQQAVPTYTPGTWNTVTLTTPFTIPGGTSVWVGYQCVTTAGQYPAGIDAGPGVYGYGDMVFTSVSWMSVNEASAGAIDGNWNIAAYVTDAAGNPAQIGYNNTPRNTREVTGYRIYRDIVLIAELSPTVSEYTDQNVASGMHGYYVTAMYGNNESDPSNLISAYIMPENYATLSNNDGSSEQGYNVGSTHLMAAKFTNNHASTIRYVRVYVHTVGTAPMIIRIFEDDGTGGLPGLQLIQFTYASTLIVSGWNNIPIPNGMPITVTDGQFYIALMEYTNASSVGLDTESNGRSIVKLSSTTGWQPLTTGEVMIEAIVENGVPVPSFNVMGIVAGNDAPDLGLENALVSLNGIIDYEGLTDNLGQFTIPLVLSGYTYDYTISKAGYQSLSGNITVNNADYDMGSIIVNEITLPVTNVQAVQTVTFELVNISWVAPSDPAQVRINPLSLRITNNGAPVRSLQGYRIWRLASGQEDDESLWTLLNPVDLSNVTDYADTGWTDIPDGLYKWAVKSVYTNNLLSEPAFSNSIIRNSEIGTLSGTIRSINNVPVNDALVAVGIYAALTDVNGDYSMLVPAGTYTVTCVAAGFLSQGLNNIMVMTGQISTCDFFMTESSIVRDGFESYTDFSTDFAPWVNEDIDESDTYGYTGITWLHSMEPQACMIFNPSATTPPSNTQIGDPHTGVKMATCWADADLPNNDWLISPVFNVSQGASFSFYAKSMTDTYGLERFNVGFSNGSINPESFTILSGASYIQAPTNWTQYTYSFPAGFSGNVRIGINCVSNDAFCFQLDDFVVYLRPPVNVSGMVTGSGDPTVGLSGATVNLTGVGTYIGTTDGQGHFSLSDVAASGTYQYTISKTGYQDATGVINVGTTDYNMNTIILTENTSPGVNVTAIENPDFSSVNVNWFDPGTEGGQWMRWDDGVHDLSIGMMSGGTFDVASRWSVDNLEAFTGQSLYAIKFYASATATFSVKVWTGGSELNPGQLVLEQLVPNVMVNAYNTVILDEFVPIPMGQELWFGYNVIQGSNVLPASTDNGPSVNGFGNLICTSSGWTTLQTLGEMFDKNWNLAGFVGYNAPTGMVLCNSLTIPQPAKVNHEFESGCFKARQESMETINDSRNDRSLLGYKVWRLSAGQESNESTWTLLTPETNVATHYIDTGWQNLPDGQYRWAVKAVYTGNVLSDVVLSNRVTHIPHTGFISGTVKDMNQIPINGATITAGDNMVTTGANGAYSIQIAVGVYSVTVSAEDYISQTQNNIVVVEGQTTSLNFNLTLVDNHDDMAIARTALKGNYPNPFNPETILSFDVKDRTPVRIDIYNTKGQLIRTLVNEVKSYGHYTAIWNGKDNHGNAVGSGIYTYRMQAGNYRDTNRMMLLK